MSVLLFLILEVGSKDGAEVRALASHQWGSNLGVHTICGLSLLLVLSFAACTPVFPSRQKTKIPNSNLTRNQEHEEPPNGSATSKSLFLCLSVIL